MVAKTENFSNASEELGYAQPTVTTHIKLLEDELQVKLFERLGHKIKLTEEGKRLLSYAESIIRLSDDALSSFAQIESVQGKITIGANESFSVAKLPEILKAFIKQHKETRIELKFGSVKEIRDGMQKNEVDVAFFLGKEVSYPDLIVEKLVKESVVAVVPISHPFAAMDCLRIEDFNDQDLIITRENCTYRELIETLLKERDVKLRSVIGINNVSAIKQLVMSGLGIAILPRATTELELEEKLLIEIPIIGYEFPVYTQIAYHKDKWISPVILCFMDQVREILHQEEREYE